MRDDDLQRRNDRRKLLIESIENTFPGHIISVFDPETAPPGLKGDSWMVRVEKDDPSRHSIVVKTRHLPLMIDVGNNYKEIFAAGIKMAKKILDNPPEPSEYYQGAILLSDEGLAFEPREKR